LNLCALNIQRIFEFLALLFLILTLYGEFKGFRMEGHQLGMMCLAAAVVGNIQALAFVG
jgi:hypothetical protein